jgi:hypothetical protein
MAGIGPQNAEAPPDDGTGARERRRLKVLRFEAGRVRIRDIFSQDLLARLMPVHPGFQHRDKREIGGGHGKNPSGTGKNCRAYG